MTEDPRLSIRHCPQCGSADLVRRTPRRDDKERICCSACDYVHYVGPILAAGAVLHRGGEICLIRRAWDPGRGLWSFPGGFVDLGEETSAAALREVVEETGYRARLEGLVGVYRSLGPRGIHVVLVAYSATPTSETDRGCEEVQEVRWYPTAELPWTELAFPSTDSALRDFLSVGGG